MNDKFPSGRWPHFEQDELDAAQRVLQSGCVNYWTGSECRDFESAFAAYHGVDYALALANGTLALELALIGLGVGPGDEVIVTPRSFFASASCVKRVGAEPVFADVSRNSQNVTADSIEQKLTARTKAVIPVHLAGWPCDMPAIMKLAENHGLYVIEDCAQAHGARISGELVGSFGHAAAFSFCQDKIMSTAGEGGMLLLKDAEVWRRSWEFRDHGKSMERVNASDHPPGFRWLHESFGTNWRLTEIQGAIGKLQLGKLASWIDRRRANAAKLIESLGHLPLLRIAAPEPHEHHAYYKFYAFVNVEKLRTGWSRDRMLAALLEEGVPGWSGSCPEIYREKAFSYRAPESLPVAQELGETSIMLPVHPTLTSADCERMIGAMLKVCASATA